MNGNLGTVVFIIIAVIILPLFASLFASFLGNIAQKNLVADWGFHSQQWLGGLGTICHELSHLLMALIFNHHIDHIKLLRLHKAQDASTLGYIAHSWNSQSWYQDTGNFLICIAPFYFCSIILYGLHVVLFHDTMYFPNRPTLSAHFTNYIMSNVLINLKRSWLSLFSYPINALLFMIFMIMISTTGYALSHADKCNMWKGLLPWSIFWILLSCIISFWNNNPADFNSYIWDFLIFSIVMAINSLLYILLSMLILHGLRYVITSGIIPKAFHKSAYYIKRK